MNHIQENFKHNNKTLKIAGWCRFLLIELEISLGITTLDTTPNYDNNYLSFWVVS